MNLEEFRNRVLRVTVKTRCDHCNKLTENEVKSREVINSRDENNVVKYNMVSCWPCYAREYMRVNRSPDYENEGSEQ